MTYHSNEFAFKKADILKILQQIDPSFNDELLGFSDTPAMDNEKLNSDIDKHLTDIRIMNEWQRSLAAVEYFDFDLASRFLAGLPASFYGSDDDLLSATMVINSGIKSGKLIKDSDGDISADNLKKFLFDKNIIFKNFNDHLIATQNTTSQITSDPKVINGLQQQLDQAHDENERLRADIEQLKAQLVESHPREEVTGFDTDRLAAILDPTYSKHAPDLAHAVNLWLALYGDGSDNKTDSHSNRANTWLLHNTGYPADATTSLGRIREISTPLCDWGSQRPREKNNT